jgi:hypothetical protein
LDAKKLRKGFGEKHKLNFLYTPYTLIDSIEYLKEGEILNLIISIRGALIPHLIPRRTENPVPGRSRFSGFRWNRCTINRSGNSWESRRVDYSGNGITIS